MDDDIPYLLLTPGPLTTSRTVRAAMNVDLSTWDVDYNDRVESVRGQLVGLATATATATDDYTSVLMQGSGTFAVEATLGSVIKRDGAVLFLTNGAYGQRMVHIAERLGIAHVAIAHEETEPLSVDRLRTALEEDSAITHIAMAHCETTTGMWNPVEAVGALAAEFGKIVILDAMSSFGGIPLRVEDVGVHYLVSSANKCIQGVPGFGFAIAHRRSFAACAGSARSLSLDLHGQWQGMEQGSGKWRFTSPTHALLAFQQALLELAEEGGVAARHARYVENHRVLVDGMRGLGFQTLLPDELQAPIITSFLYPSPDFDFRGFYDALKARRFVLYPGKVSDADTFRIGNIGHVFPADMRELVAQVAAVIGDLGIRIGH